MKIILNFCCLLFVHQLAFSQNHAAMAKEYGGALNYGVSSLKSKIGLYINVDDHTQSINPYNSLPADPLGNVVYLEGTKTVKVTTRIRKDSLSYYRYSIVENDTLVSTFDAKLTKVDFVWNKYSSWPGYLTMDLGVSNIIGKKITIKIYRFPRVAEVSTLIIYNKPFPLPKLKEIMLVSKGKNDKFNLVPLKNAAQIKVTDSTTGIFIKMQKSDLDFAQNLLLKHTKDNKSETINLGNNWRYNSDDGNPIANIEPMNFKTPGDYEILLQTQINKFRGFKQPNPTVVLKFSVLTPPRNFSISELMAIIMVIVVLGCVVILVIRSANKKKELAIILKADVAKNELNSVRAQLNPHFVFNALSGIQSLMNNNEIEEANNYLGRFANLTRQILDERELITIEDEIILLKDYLIMEQLRFPFIVDFNVSIEESYSYVEIPTMLLQPFVENAVKHGVAGLKGNGRIKVDIKNDQQNIVLSVKDNGKGFDDSVVQNGLGLKLSKKRIALLNENYKTCPIEFSINSSFGTTVQITLTNWLA